MAKTGHFTTEVTNPALVEDKIALRRIAWDTGDFVISYDDGRSFFEDLYESQINTVNDSIIEDAATIILRLLYFISTSDKGIDMKKDETIIEALKWLKNHKTK